MLSSTHRTGRRRPSALTIVSVLVLIVVSACSSTDSAPATTEPVEPEAAVAETAPSTTGPAQPETASAETPTGSTLELPVREGPRRQTTGSVPHVQLDAEPVADVDAELRRRAFQLPGIENLPSDRSLPGARGLAFSEGVELARPEVIAGSGEFAHIHPDGSLHVWLAVDSAIEVDDKKWGELHPWVGRDGFWDGVAMVYTPETLDEVEVAIQILVDAYNFVTGSSLDPTDIP